MMGGDFVFDGERARTSLAGGLPVEKRVSWPPLCWDPAVERYMVRAHDLPRRPQRPRSRAGIELPPYYAAVQVERQLERASALGYLVLPETRVEQLRLVAWRNTWWLCTQERYPFVYVLVGQQTPFGRRLALHWDTGFLIADDRELDERLRAAWGACRDGWEAWWRQMPQAACRAMVPRPSSSVCEWAASGGMVRAVEGAPRPIELAFEALNAAFEWTAYDGRIAEWQAVADARAYEAMHPPRLARAPSRGPTRTCAECHYTFVDAGPDRLRHRNWHDRTLNGLPLPKNLASGAGLLVIRPSDPVPQQRIAYQLGQLLRQAAGYDFNMCFYAKRRRPDDEEIARYHAACVVAVRDGRAVGIVIVRRRAHGGWWDPESNMHRAAPPDTAGWAIERIHVVPAWRRRGLGTALTYAAAGLCGVTPGELLHSPPFTEAGKALANSTAGGGPLAIRGH